MNTTNKFKRAAAMGSAASGSHHWMAQRLTAVALIPLLAWFIFSIAGVVGEDINSVQQWIGNPINAGLVIAFLIAGFYHGALGLQVMIEDYIPHKGVNIALLMSVRLLAFILSIIGVVSVIMIAL